MSSFATAKKNLITACSQAIRNGHHQHGLELLWAKGMRGTPSELDRLEREIAAAVDRAVEDFRW